MYEILIPLLQSEFKKAFEESYQDINPKETIVYPYLTWSFNDEPIEHNVDGFYLDIDIFDRNTSLQRVYEVQSKIRKHFEHLEIMTEDVYLRVVNYGGGNTIPKPEETLKQRNVTFYVKIDWRKK